MGSKVQPAAAAGTATPSLAATQRAVASRRAVMPRIESRAWSRIAAGAVSGVPLLKGGSGA